MVVECSQLEQSGVLQSKRRATFDLQWEQRGGKRFRIRANGGYVSLSLSRHFEQMGDWAEALV